MKQIHYKASGGVLGKTNRTVQLLREIRRETTQRSVICYGWFLLSAFTIVSVLALVLLLGLGKISLSDKVILALISATIAR